VKCNFRRKTAVLRFCLGATYNVHLRLIGKRVVDFPLHVYSKLIERFSLGVTAEGTGANIDWKSAFLLQQGQFGPKFEVEGISPTNRCFCQKTMMNDHSCSVRIWQKFLSSCHNPRVWQTDRRTDGRTDRKALQYHALHYTQSHGKNLKSREYTVSFKGIDDASDSITPLAPVIGNNGSSEWCQMTLRRCHFVSKSEGLKMRLVSKIEAKFLTFNFIPPWN